MEKFNPTLKQLLRKLPMKGEERVNLLLRVAGPFQDSWREELSNAGCSLRTVAGDIVTLDALLEDVPMLGNLDFVVYMELSGNLYLEPE